MLPKLGSLAAYTRDDPRYWNQKPRDHSGAGLFVYGPQEHRPAWPYEVKNGTAHTAPAVESREAILAREAETKRARLRRMALGTTGAFTGQNRPRRGFVHRVA